MQTYRIFFVFLLAEVMCYKNCMRPDPEKYAYGHSCNISAECITDYCNSSTCLCDKHSFYDSVSQFCVKNQNNIIESDGNCGYLVSQRDLTPGSLNSWTIYGNNQNTYVTLVVLDIDMYPHSCLNNYLLIDDGYTTLLNKTCRKPDPVKVLASKSYFVNVHYLAATSNYSGFRAVYFITGKRRKVSLGKRSMGTPERKRKEVGREKRYRGYGSDCGSYYSCSREFICISGRCRCGASDYFSSSSRSCLQRIAHSYECSESDYNMCQENLFCNKYQRCECKSGFTYDVKKGYCRNTDKAIKEFITTSSFGWGSALIGLAYGCYYYRKRRRMQKKNRRRHDVAVQKTDNTNRTMNESETSPKTQESSSGQPSTSAGNAYPNGPIRLQVIQRQASNTELDSSEIVNRGYEGDLREDVVRVEIIPEKNTVLAILNNLIEQ